MAEQWSRPDAALLRIDAEGHVATRPSAGLDYAIPTGTYQPSRHLLIGIVEGRPVFAEDADLASDSPTLRTVMDRLAPVDLQVAFTAAGLVIWHRSAVHCSACGTETEVRHAGSVRMCPGCAREWFPRTDPAIIVAVLDPDGRLLLGRQPAWPQGRLSVFAGFVETGESLEQAVHREVAEEVGLPLTAVAYLGSQPWPFPRSLMVGFVARTDQVEVKVRAEEIESARWFTRPDLESALVDGAVSLPAPTSIAFRMIQAWREERLPAPSVPLVQPTGPQDPLSHRPA